jgi:hypothetical protein
LASCNVATSCALIVAVHLARAGSCSRCFASTQPCVDQGLKLAAVVVMLGG